VPLLRVVQRTSTHDVFVATLAYSITLFEIDVTSWSAPAGVLYFRMEPTDAWLAFGAGIGGGSIVYGTLLALAFQLRRRAGRPLSPVWCAALWSVWEWLRAYVPPFLPASVLGTSQREFLPVLQLASVTGSPASRRSWSRRTPPSQGSGPSPRGERRSRRSARSCSRSSSGAASG
jgi:apolipoprotein N-acyltransferase